jgi:hypothetical protein
MLQLKYHIYVTIKSPIKKCQEEVYLMYIANPILNLEKERKKRKIFFYIPRNTNIVYWSKSPFHKCLVDDSEKYIFLLVFLMENG